MSSLLRDAVAAFRAPAGATGAARHAGLAAAVFLGLQLALPATYYGRRDPQDERFAWRMFSTMRMARCQPTLRVSGQPVVLSAQFHEAWLELAGRGRRGVLEAMAQHLCARYPGQPVALELSCEYLDGSRRQLGGTDDVCKDLER